MPTPAEGCEEGLGEHQGEHGAEREAEGRRAAERLLWEEVQSAPEHMRSLLGALRYAGLGIPVLPVAASADGSKRPRTRWQTGGRWSGATCDLEVIAWWWKKSPGDLVACVLGAESGWWALDVDVKDGQPGLESLARLAEEVSPLGGGALTVGGLDPVARLAPAGAVRTRSGGLHLWQPWPLDSRGVKRGPEAVRSRDRLEPGVEVKAGGRYVVCPPSPGWRWLDPPDWEAPRQAPAALLALVRGRKAASRRGAGAPGPGLGEATLEWAARAVEGASSHRNDKLNQAAWALRPHLPELGLGASVSRLARAARACQMFHGSAVATIASGLGVPREEVEALAEPWEGGVP